MTILNGDVMRLKRSSLERFVFLKGNSHLLTVHNEDQRTSRSTVLLRKVAYGGERKIEHRSISPNENGL